MSRYEERIFLREFGIRRKKGLKRVKEKVVRSEKKKNRIMTYEGVVSKVKKKKEEDPIFTSKGDGRVISYAKLV